jgi:hypothetical protein
MTAYTYVTSGTFQGYIATEQIYQELLRTYYYYSSVAADGTNNLLIGISEQDISSGGSGTTRYSATLYNQWSQPIRAWGPTTTALVTPFTAASPTNPFGGATVINWTFQYQDPLNPYLMTQMTDPNAYITSWVFDDYGNNTQMTDARGNLTTYQFRSTVSPYLLTQINPPLIQAVGDTGLTPHPTVLSYDGVGNLSSIEDAANNTITFTRANFSHTGTYASVADGRITSIKDRNNNTTTIAYTSSSNYTNNNNIPTNTGNVSSVTFPSGYGGPHCQDQKLTFLS